MEVYWKRLNTIWEVNDTLKYSENDSISVIWNVNFNFKIAHIEESWRGIEVWKHPDKLEVWNIDSELKFWSENNNVSAWKRDNYITFMQANDSTKVWQINSEIRLSQVNDVLKIWKRLKTDEGYKWLISNEFKPIRFQYQGKPMVIKIYDNLQIWQHNKIVSFWKRDLTRRILTINDIMKVYSFVPEYFTPKEKRKSNWKIGGVGGLDFSQAYFKDWVKGGENKLALLSSLKFYGNYEKDKVKWTNELVVKLGTIKPGENSFRKNEDNYRVEY